MAHTYGTYWKYKVAELATPSYILSIRQFGFAILLFHRPSSAWFALLTRYVYGLMLYRPKVRSLHLLRPVLGQTCHPRAKFFLRLSMSKRDSPSLNAETGMSMDLWYGAVCIYGTS